jgi:hypothetical protein
MNDQSEVTRENTNPALEGDASAAPVADAAPADDEFQLTIRKLEMPVRPRGVLAE